MTNSHISKGFIIAGVMNLSVLIFSKGFTNTVIPVYYPEVMSNFGMLMIAVWGLAYMAVANSFQHVKWLVMVFALEKLIYVISWLFWLLDNNLGEVYDKDVFAAAFYSIYGINDLLFCFFFIFVFIRIQGNK